MSAKLLKTEPFWIWKKPSKFNACAMEAAGVFSLFFICRNPAPRPAAMFLEVGLSQCSKQFRPGGRSGQVVQSVEPGSIAEELGILPGDRLLSVNGEPVADVFAYRLAVMIPKLCWK